MKRSQLPPKSATLEAEGLREADPRQRTEHQRTEHQQTEHQQTDPQQTDQQQTDQQQTDQQQTDQQQTDQQQTEAEQALARLQRARSGKLRRLLSVLEPQRQAEVVLRANGLEPPQALLDAVVEFEVDHAGAFAMTLRQPVTVDGVTFGRFVSGQGGPRRLEQLTGVRDAQGPVARLEATRDGALRPAGPGR